VAGKLTAIKAADAPPGTAVCAGVARGTDGFAVSLFPLAAFVTMSISFVIFEQRVQQD